MFIQVDRFIINIDEISMVADCGSYISVVFRDGSSKILNTTTFEAFKKAIFKEN